MRGVLQPVLDKYAVGFRVMHGFSSATAIFDVAQDDDGRPLVALYVGDFDPSGLFMSEVDLPKRLVGYDGNHVKLKRIRCRASIGGQAMNVRRAPRSHYGRTTSAR